jgi:hypothetical protein
MRYAICILALALIAIAMAVFEGFHLRVLRDRSSALASKAFVLDFDRTGNEIMADLAVQMQSSDHLGEIVVKESERQRKQSALQAELNELRARTLSASTTLTAAYWSAFGLIGLGLAIMPGFVINGRKGQFGPDERLFISYNHRDVELARFVMGALRADGMQPTLVDTILDARDDDHLKQILRDAVALNGSVVVVLTDHSLQSNWVGFERVLGDSQCRNVIYLLRGVTYIRAVRKTLLLHKAASFKMIRSVKATRRYVTWDPDGKWTQLVRAYAAAADDTPGRSARKLLLSVGTLDMLFFQWFFDFIESRAITRPGRLWRWAGRFGVMLQLYFSMSIVLGIVTLFAASGYMAYENHAYHEQLRQAKLE